MAKRKKDHGEAAPPVQADAPKAYEVGHGRPPVASRFKPGQSGNPKGRPKAAKNLSTLLREKLEGKVPVREGGREWRMSKGELGVTKLVNKFAETGDPKLYMVMLKETEGTPTGKEAAAARTTATAAEEQAGHAEILAWYLEQHRAGEGSES